MSRPSSYNSDPWTTFSRQSDSIFTEDFVQDKLLVIKTTHRPSLGIVKFKQMVSNHKNRYQLDQEIKLWTPVWNLGGSVFLRVKKNEAKTLYEHGVRQYAGSLINFYGGFQSEKDFTKTTIKAGAQLLGINTSFNSRLRLVQDQNGKYELSSAHKINWVNKNWAFDSCQVINYQNLSLFKNSFRFIYTKNNQQFFVKADNRNLFSLKNFSINKLNSCLSHLTLDYINTLDSRTKAGVQVIRSLFRFNSTNLTFQMPPLLDKTKITAKVSTNRTAALSVQSHIGNYGKWIFGFEVQDIGNKNISKIGLKFDLNL